MKKYDIVVTNSFKRDLKRIHKQGKNLDHLFEVIDQLSEGMTLDAKYHDHKLSGNYEGKRECHIEPDFLLIYEIQEKDIVLYLIRAGSHSELFR